MFGSHRILYLVLINSYVKEKNEDLLGVSDGTERLAASQARVIKVLSTSVDAGRKPGATRYQGAYWVKTESRGAFAWQGAQVSSAAAVPGLPSLSKCAYPHPPVEAHFFESFTMN